MNKVFVLCFFFSSLGLGADVFNLGLRVNLEYSDLNTHCRLSALVEPFRLAAEVEEGRVLKAQLSKRSRFLEPFTYELSEEESAGLEFREESNLFWIRRFYVSPQLLRTFLFAGKGFASDSCIPPADFETIPLDGILFDFGVDSVDYLLPHLISSEEVILRGKLESSKPFRIRISLTQDRR